MNSFGRIFRISIFGESHGPAVGIVVDGCPAGIALSENDFSEDLERRKGGKAGTTTRSEADVPKFISGLFNGHTTGAPLTIQFENGDVRSGDYEALKNTPRPGHADWVLHQKFGGFNDPRGGGHSSGRLTACLVAAGVVAKKVLKDVSFRATLIEAGGEKDIESAIKKATEINDSIGGVVECRVHGLPAGLGEPFFDSLESVISHLAFSIPAIKGIEFGSGFSAAGMHGRDHNDPIINEEGSTSSNHAGGINGGISNGNELVFRMAVKPASSTPQVQQSWNKETKSIEALQVKGRHDLCIALRVPVVAEAVAAIAICDLFFIHSAIKA